MTPLPLNLKRYTIFGGSIFFSKGLDHSKMGKGNQRSKLNMLSLRSTCLNPEARG